MTFNTTVVACLAAFAMEKPVMAAPGVCAGDSDRPADIVIVNAKIWTGIERSVKHGDRLNPPTALAVQGAAIVAVGYDTTVRARIGPNTRVIDAKGRRVIPGITDSHTHIIGGGLQLTRVALRGVTSRNEFIRAVANEAKARQPGQWVLGGRWSVESWREPESPRRDWLDPVTGDTPVYLTRMDGHQALVNSAALRLAGIDASGPNDPPGGEIERDPKTREPTGILKESAKDLVWNLIPKPSVEERYAALRRAMKHANSLGVTSVHNMSQPEDVEVFRRAHADDALTLRITAYLEDDDWSVVLDTAENSDLRHDMVRVVGVKGYMDGSLGSRTAYMREPYNDATPQTAYPRGQLTAFAASHEAFEKQVVAACARGLQPAIHAIGDQANHLVLEAYESLVARGRRSDIRPRIEHAQHLLVTDIARFAQLGVVASMQPFHKADDGRYAEKAIGKARLAGSYAFRQLVDSGAMVCFGSDWPVVTINPFAGIDSAVNAKTVAGEVWLPSHSLSVEEALRAYTVWPPRAIHQEGRLGTLETGKLADILILDDDPLTIPTERLAKVKVAYTLVAGRVVYAGTE